MKTLEQIAVNYEDWTIDGRQSARLVQFLRFDQLSKFGLQPKDGITEEEFNNDVKPFTRENILEQLKKDVAFGFEKALDKRGISSGLMFECVKFWNNILEEGLENWSDDDYEMYGLPLFKATAVKYGWDNPIGNDRGDEYKYSEYSDYE